MKPLKASFAIILLLLTIKGPAWAQIKGTAMGGLVSIASDGAFDVSRNPALLSLQKSESAMGAFVRYRVYDYYDISFENAPGMIDQDVSSTLVAGGGFAYASRSGKSVTGIFLGEAGPDLFSLTGSESKLIYGPSTVQQRDDVKTTEMNPAIGISLAYAVSDHGSIGFQFLAGYSQKDMLTERDLSNAGILSEKLEINQTTRTIKFTAGFGYVYNTPETQVGVLIRPGTGAFEQEQVELQYKDLLDSDLGGLGPGPYVDNSRDRTRLTPFHGAYTDGINIAIGGYKRLSPMFAFAFESAYTMANSYTGQDFTIKDDTDQDVHEAVKLRNVINMKDTLTFRGGIDVMLSPALSVMAGLGYGFFENNSSTISDESNFRSRNEYSIIYATTGCTYALSASSTVSILANAAKVTSEADLKQETFSVSLNQDLILVDVGIGVSLAF